MAWCQLNGEHLTREEVRMLFQMDARRAEGLAEEEARMMEMIKEGQTNGQGG